MRRISNAPATFNNSRSYSVKPTTPPASPAMAVLLELLLPIICCIGAPRDFIKRAIVHFGYIPACIQTDNGGEFTNPRGAGCKKVHAADEIMNKLKIKHQLIRAYTPRHNGKVERSHRTDSENFYRSLKFDTYEELCKKMRDWCNRYNNCPHSALRDKDGRRAWITPLQKRAELLDELKSAAAGVYHVRLLKPKAA